MNLEFRPMTIDSAKEISSWRYSGFMKEIFMDPYIASYATNPGDIRGPGDCFGFAVFNEGILFGLFEYYPDKDGFEIGIAIRPDLVGKKLSTEFIRKGVDFGLKRFNNPNASVRLSVDIENRSAYLAYLKAGFHETNRNHSEIFMKL